MTLALLLCLAAQEAPSRAIHPHPADTDAALPSPHPHIQAARLGSLRVAAPLAAAAELVERARRGDDAGIRAQLAAILPDYDPGS